MEHLSRLHVFADHPLYGPLVMTDDYVNALHFDRRIARWSGLATDWRTAYQACLEKEGRPWITSPLAAASPETRV